MKLKKYSYERMETGTFNLNALRIDDLELQDINLLVGKNAAGKSTVARTLQQFSNIIKGTSTALGRFYLELEGPDSKSFKYRCNIDLKNDALSISEKLSIDDFIVLDRLDSDAKIYSFAEQKLLQINPPSEKIIAQVRRDEKEYPYLETLVEWAECVHIFKFGHIHTTLLPFTSSPDPTSINHKDLNVILGKLTDKAKKQVIDEFNSLGYRIEILSIRFEGEQNVIFVKEDGVKYEIHQVSLSQGMFRSLFLIIFVHHLVEREKTSLIVVDDLCEGLDYDRATKLGKLLFNKLSGLGIQLIATSNDYFLINTVDVKYWNILSRRGSEILVNNYTNSRSKFDQFRLSGLSNFDLLSSNYLNE